MAAAAAKRGGKAIATSSKSVAIMAASNSQNGAEKLANEVEALLILISLFSLICWVVGSLLYDDGD